MEDGEQLVQEAGLQDLPELRAPSATWRLRPGLLQAPPNCAALEKAGPPAPARALLCLHLHCSSSQFRGLGLWPYVRPSLRVLMLLPWRGGQVQIPKIERE